MRLHILGDLHLEFGPVRIPAPDADIVVLAGDIHLGREGRKWARNQFPAKPVIYVLGNHEFYRHSLPDLTETLNGKRTAAKSIFWRTAPWKSMATLSWDARFGRIIDCLPIWRERCG